MKHVRSDYGRVISGLRKVLDKVVINSEPALRDRAVKAQYHVAELSKLFYETYTSANSVNQSSSASGSNTRHKVTNTTPNDSAATSSGEESSAAFKKSTFHIDNIPEPGHTTKSEVSSDYFNNSALNNYSIQSVEVSRLDVDKAIGLDSPDNATQMVLTGSDKDRAADLLGFNSINSSHISFESPQEEQLESKVTVTATKTEGKGSSVPSSKAMRERAVPATQVGRLFGFGSLAVRMAFGAAVERASNSISGNQHQQSYMSDENAERLAEALCRMRGAALKLGQMLSLQDEASLPSSLSKALERVKQAADYMPKRQLEAQLVKELGHDWRSKFLDFDSLPIAAASIGQVHKATLLDGTQVAVKIQYPTVADSIESDLNNLKMLVNMTNILPPGLFVDNIIKVASEELSAECNYSTEAVSQIRYRELVLDDPILRRHTYVPRVFPDLCTNRVLTTELVTGEAIDRAASLDQKVRNAIARTVLVLTIRELFTWRFIQSDPNFANFLYDDPKRTINLIDFGAARAYSKEFVDGYMKLVWAAANEDKQTILEVSQDLGFITGDETPEFTRAHVEAGLIVGEPFLKDEPFDFGNSHLTAKLGQYGGTFMKYRLTPPPTEAYSLHRKLAGAFLLCIKLKANIRCRDILADVYATYQFEQ